MADTRPTTVLIVDDEPDLRDMLSLILDMAGMQVVTAGNGREALAILEHERPDLILLDMRMPVMDGWTFAPEFHRLHDHEVPIVVISAAADAARSAAEVGASAWLGKPFNADDLLAIVHRYARAPHGSR